MHDRIDAVEGTPHRLVVADVSDLQLDLRVQIAGPLAPGVHLGLEAVERTHLVPLGEEAIGEVGADEPGSTRDENTHAHVDPRVPPPESGGEAAVTLSRPVRTLRHRRMNPPGMAAATVTA